MPVIYKDKCARTRIVEALTVSGPAPSFRGVSKLGFCCFANSSPRHHGSSGTEPLPRSPAMGGPLLVAKFIFLERGY